MVTKQLQLVAVSCSCVTLGLAGLVSGYGTTGKLGLAWVTCMGAWHDAWVHGMVHGILGLTVPEPVTPLWGGCYMKSYFCVT